MTGECYGVGEILPNDITDWRNFTSIPTPRVLLSDVTVVVTNKLTLIRGGSHVHGGKWSQLRCPAPGPQPSVGPIAGSGPARIAESPSCPARHGLTPRPGRNSADRSAVSWEYHELNVVDERASWLCLVKRSTCHLLILTFGVGNLSSKLVNKIFLLFL